MKPIALSCALLALAAAQAETPRDRVALFIRSAAYDRLKTEIERYKRDVQARFPVRLQIVKGDWANPEEVRDAVKRCYKEDRVTGVVLVGGVPMHRFHMHDFDNPDPLYYEDFDLRFVSSSGREVPDAYVGAPDLKLWVANLRAVEQDGDDGIEQLRAFLDKTHAYYTGKQKIERRALAVTGSDWPDGAEIFAKNVARPIFGPDGCDVLSCKAASLEALRDAFAKHTYTVFYIQVHSTCTRQDMDTGGTIWSKEIEQIPTGAVFIVNHGCSTCNWSKAIADKGRNTCMSWVFGKGVGEAVMGNVRTGMVYGQDALYERILAGDYLGRAYFAAKKSAEDEMHREYPNGDVVSGVTFVGNPFVTLRPGRG